jgi:predicted HTH domain antitoxin
VQTFDTRDLPDRIDDLIRAAESGGLSIVMRAGRPIFVAVPFDDTLLGEGIKVALARRLFDQEAISLAQAARLTGTSVAEFMAHLRRAGIPIARPRPGELERELADFG